MEYEYGIIGGGPAGYTLAVMLANKGKKVILFEKDKIGGTCLNSGCIPTKSLLHSSERYKNITKASEIGLDLNINSFDFSKVAQKRDMTVERLRKSMETILKNIGVKIIYGEAFIKNKNLIIVNNEEYYADEIIFAGGAKPREIKGLKFDGKFILNSDDILKLSSLPKSVLIAGSGAIGIEWARILSNFGVEVTVTELAEHLIPAADIDVSKRIERIFKQNKIKYFLNDCIEKIENRNVFLKSGAKITPDFILVAAGRTPIKPNMNNIRIIGDSSGEIQLAHYAIQQAKQLALEIECDKNLIPYVIYGEPEIAWVGLREQDCTEDCKSTILPITALGKSWCDEATEGFIKVITQNNLIVGAHIISKEASSLIHEFLIAIRNKLEIDDLKNVCYAHPTYSEGIFEILLKT